MQASASEAWSNESSLPANSSLDSYRVLILNGSYEPIGIVSWQRGLLLYLGSKTELLEIYDRAVRSVSQTFALPSVLRLRRFVRQKKKRTRPQFSRYHVFLRDAFQCQYCSEFFTVKELTMDHVVPVVQGGETSWSNIVSCCVDCNQLKGGKTPDQAGLKLLRVPREPHVGFMPDLFYFNGSLPESWKSYLAPSDLSFFENNSASFK